jgi:hypothetical protein
MGERAAVFRSKAAGFSIIANYRTFDGAPDHWHTIFTMTGNQPLPGPREFSERRLMFALGLAAAVLHGFSSTAWAAYWGTPPEVPDAVPWTLLAIVGAFGLYALRCWRPIIYGLVEIIAAVFIIYFSIAPATQSATTVCNGKALWGVGCYFQSFLIILAGIYIFVRGLDNIQARRLLCVVQAWRRKRRGSSPDED